MVDSVFLKLPRRIEALMFVMTLCLLVYNVAQYRLRESLKDQEETLPNQLNTSKKPLIFLGKMVTFWDRFCIINH